MTQRLTYVQQLAEENHALSEAIKAIPPETLDAVPRNRQVFRYLSKRKEKCEKAIKAFHLEPSK